MATVSPPSAQFAAALAALQTHQSSHPLAIHGLSETIVASAQTAAAQNHRQQTSQSQSPHPRPSTDPSLSLSAEPSDLTPSSLTLDLTHYRDLFAKLRFSYLEQVTKEKYLRGIVGDPPIVVSHQDNLDLEADVKMQKKGLQRKKRDVEGLVERLEGEARGVAGRVEGVEEGRREMERVLERVGELERREGELRGVWGEKMEGLRAAGVLQGVDGEGADALQLAGLGSDTDATRPRQHLSLTQTQSTIQQRRQETHDMDLQIAELQRQLSVQMRECETAERDLDGLERRKDEAVLAAREARRVKEEGGRDQVAELGRWYRGVEAVMTGLGVGGGREWEDGLGGREEMMLEA